MTTNWVELARRVRTEIQQEQSAILKSDGDERRLVILNDGQEIGMRTGRTTKAVHTISYDMIRFAFETLSKTGKFDSDDFRSRFASEYRTATCRYSMTGGVLVELGVAARVITGRNRCYYVRRQE